MTYKLKSWHSEHMLQEEIKQILEKVFKEKGFDFRQYKESTLTRRLERRFKTTKAASYQEYLAILDADPAEYKRLLDDLTIKVTEFFRDSEAWEVVAQKVLPGLLTPSPHRGEGCLPAEAVVAGGEGGVRIWSAGCATGEEAYSIAILLDQFLNRSAVRPELVEGREMPGLQFTIHATDIDNDTLIKAQEAKYSPLAIKGVPRDIQNKYFVPAGDFFVVEEHLRNLIHFGLHNLVLDEPLRDTDLILCRNVLIYFDRPLQEKVLMDFYNSFNEGGYLFLGKAETLISPARERFKVIDKRWKIYKKE